MKALEDRKLVFVCVQNSTSKQRKAAMRGIRKFKNDKRFADGTEIIKVNGTPVGDYLATLPLIRATGVRELQPYLRAPRLFRFPAGERAPSAFRRSTRPLST